MQQSATETKEKTSISEEHIDEVKTMAMGAVDYNFINEKVAQLRSMVPMKNIKFTYRNFNTIGETCRGVITGYSTLVKRGKTLETILWKDEEGNGFMSAAVILVGDAKNAGLTKGDAIQIEYTGKKGDALNFTVMRMGY